MGRIAFGIPLQLALIFALSLFGCGHKPAPISALPPPS